MRTVVKIPRILKIKTIKGHLIVCIFNNGETRKIDFEKLFKKWKVNKKSAEAILLNEMEFKKVKLRNQTLSWSNVKLVVPKIGGGSQIHPYELSPDMLYAESESMLEAKQKFYFGSIIKSNRIKKGLSQDELAKLSGTSKTYISRIENDLLIPEITTLSKIIEIGLGKKMKIVID
jgi:DNA-binding XRE family transcriptional regulator